jgi:hypothetical protein
VPSIEIICIGQREPSELPGLPFALCAESQLVSHRSPSLFQADFDKLQGCIYHLGSAFCGDPGYKGPFFAYELLNDNCHDAHRNEFLQFDASIIPKLVDLFGRLLDASPENLIVFTTDWQFGPHPARRYRAIRERTFWKRHTQRKLHLNALYPIRANE